MFRLGLSVSSRPRLLEVEFINESDVAVYPKATPRAGPGLIVAVYRPAGRIPTDLSRIVLPAIGPIDRVNVPSPTVLGVHRDILTECVDDVRHVGTPE